MKPIVPISIALFSMLSLTAEPPPWKAIYSNDTTNIFNCKSPYNPNGDDRLFTDAMIRASVDEAAVPGMGAQMLQPGHGWVAWWPSKLVPLAEHEAWFRKTFGVEPSIAVQKYLLAGGDLIGVFIDECHKRGEAALVSYRVNDNHHLEWVTKGNPTGAMAHAISKFYVDHPEYRLKLGATESMYRVHNWLIPQARQYKLDLIHEMLQTYPGLDGLELDFLRFPNYFPEDTPADKRVQVMVGFIKQVRAYLNEMPPKKDGQPRYLGVRVPIEESGWGNIGFAPKAWYDAGVNFFDLSPSYRMQEKMSVAQVRKAAPDSKIYVELTHTTQTWKFGGPGYDDHCWRRNTKEMFENTARIAYAQGADGVSFFNFVYYRPHGGYLSRKGPFNEPPFEYIPQLADKKALENIPGYFFLAANNENFAPDGPAREYHVEALPAKGNGPGLLRIQVLTRQETANSEVEPPAAIDRGAWTVSLNGQKLAPAPALKDAYPFPTPFEAGFGYPEQYQTFAVPAGALKSGDNTVAITHTSGPELQLRWIEIVQPSVP